MSRHATITDTTDEAFDVQLDGFRRMTPHERIRKMCAWSSQLKRMAFAAIRRRHPEFSEDEVRWKFIEITYGEELAEGVRRWQQERTGE